MTKDTIKETAKKYDRSIVAILTGLGVLASAYIATSQKLNALIKDTPCIKAIEVRNIEQDGEMKLLNEQIMNLVKVSDNLVKIHLK